MREVRRHPIIRSGHGTRTSIEAWLLRLRLRLVLIRHHIIRPRLWEITSSSALVQRVRRERVVRERHHLSAISMMRRRREPAYMALGISTSATVWSLRRRRRIVSAPAVHVVVVGRLAAAHGLHGIRKARRWCSVGVPLLLSGDAVVARWVARGAPTVLSLRTGAIVCSRRGRIAWFNIVLLLPLSLVCL